MIKNILIPERLGNYYIFSKRIIGFDIDKTHVTATQIYLKGSSITIERCIDEILDTSNELTHEERVTKAISNITTTLDKFDEIYTSISSLNVVFKSIRLPFINYEKIKSVIGYEVEPLLPFSMNDAVIDFVVTKEIKEENISEVMVAAVQKNSVEQHVKLFTDAGVQPEKVSVDLLSLYSFYKNIPEYENIQGGVVLIDIGFNVTRLSFINNGQMVFVRTFPKGIISQAKDFAKNYSVSQNEAAEMIMRYGYNKEDEEKYKEAIAKAATIFWSDIKFTIHSFISNLQEGIEISQVLILGQGAKIIGITEFAGNFLSVGCSIFRTNSLSNKPNIYIKNSLTIPSSNIISLATVFPSPITDKFNLYQFSDGASDEKIVAKQLSAFLVFLFILLSLLFLNSYIKVGKLKTEIDSSGKNIKQELSARFKLSESDMETVDGAIAAAERQVAEADRQTSFVGEDRFSFLKYLFILTKNIDKEGTGIKISKLTISQIDNTIKLDATVKSRDAASRLTTDLRKNKDYFAIVPGQYSEKIDLVIDLKKK